MKLICKNCGMDISKYISTEEELKIAEAACRALDVYKADYPVAYTGK